MKLNQHSTVLSVMLCLFIALPGFSQQLNLNSFGKRMQKQAKSTESRIKAKSLQSIASYESSGLPDQRNCGTVEYNEELRQKYPDIPSIEEFEKIFGQQVEAYKREQLSRETNEVLTIPIIVHVVHNGESVGTGPNLSAAQVQSQIDVLNEDYRRTGAGANTNPVGADVEIVFAPALFDPQGRRLTEPGIHRVNGGQANWVRAQIQATLKPQTSWDPNRYLNMWTVNWGIEPNGRTLLGYAQFPSLSGLSGVAQNGGLAVTDGVAMSATAFGRTGNVRAPFDKGRTTTHEVGHWLGLRHIWGDGGCSVDDFCNDTPVAGNKNFGCPVGRNTCPSSPGNDMIENYMDYTDDNCMNVFTNDQKARMRTVMSVSPRRMQLLNSTVHIDDSRAPGAPVAIFGADPENVCGGTTVTLQDQSENGPTAWNWTIVSEFGDTVGTSSTQNYEILLEEPGLYTVELAVSNGGGTDTLTEENFIVILSNELANDSFEDFEGFDNPLQNWILFNPDSDREFGVAQDISAFGEGEFSLVFDNYSLDDDPSGTIDALISPRFDFTGVGNPYLTFAHAYAQYSEDFSDTLVFYYSVDCGASFIPLWFLGGEDLSSAPPTTEPFVPTTEQWDKSQLSLGFLAGQPSVHIAIANISGWGNNLYLDDLAFFNGNDRILKEPDAAFSSETRRVCAGDLVEFQDRSTEFPQAWLWEFEGGTPDISEAQHPFIVYETPGTYSVRLTAANNLAGEGSTTEEIDYIEVVALPEVAISPSQEIVCEDGSVLLTASGAESYLWFDERNNAFPVFDGPELEVTLVESRTFTVRGFNELGCAQEMSIRINVSPLPETPDIAIQGDTLTAVVMGDSTLLYSWYLGDTVVAEGMGAEFSSFVISQTGDYRVEVSNEAGCTAVSPAYNVILTNINPLDLSEQVKVYPNPTQDNVNIQLPSTKTSLWKMTVQNAIGQEISFLNQELKQQETTINLANLPRGVYLLHFTNGEARATKKIVKR